MVTFLKSKITRSNYVTEGEKEMVDKVSGECMMDEDTDSDSEGDKKRKIKYLKLGWRSADLEELIECRDSRRNIKRTSKM